MHYFIRLIILSTIIASSSANAYWKKSVDEASLSMRPEIATVHFDLAIVQFKQALSPLNSQSKIEITLPRADGSISSFWVEQTTVLEPELALKYPDFKTYKIQHSSKPDVRGRMELMDDQLSAVIKTAKGQELLIAGDKPQQYQLRKRRELSPSQFSCGTKRSESNRLDMILTEDNRYRPAVNSLRQLRVAIATTVEYSAIFGSTKASVLAELTRAVNRINEVYESELAVTLVLVASNEDIIFIGTDSFSNSSATNLIDQNQRVVNSIIGSSNYDLGHVFSTGGGGLASVSSVCSSLVKAQGVTGVRNPTGDHFWIDYVAHEMGHQLGAEHSFNGSTGSCSNRYASAAYEPGSGSTIMGYANICDEEDIQTNSDANFHTVSINEINDSFSRIGACGTAVSYSSISGSTNTASPQITPLPDRSIPISTAFVLSGVATDANADALYYQWDGNDKGTVTSKDTLGCDLGDNPLMRSNLAQTTNTRYFPSIESLLSGFSHKGETLPTTSRNLNFRLKVTDNHGGIDTDEFKLSAVSTIGPFKVSSQSAVVSHSANESISVAWNVANTTSAPVSCAQVDIKLLNISADGGRFCEQTLSSNEPNDGSALITLPDQSSANSRLMVSCSSNVFFALNEANIIINGGSSIAETNCLSTRGGVQISTDTRVSASLDCPAVNIVDNSSSSSSSGGGAIALWFLWLVLGYRFLERCLNRYREKC